jgi:hypothetical protein
MAVRVLIDVSLGLGNSRQTLNTAEVYFIALASWG